MAFWWRSAPWSGWSPASFLAGHYYHELLPWVEHFVHEYAAAAAIAFLFVAFGVMLGAAILGRVLRWILHGYGIGLG